MTIETAPAPPLIETPEVPEPEVFPWEEPPPAQVHIDLSVRVRPDTPLVSYVFPADNPAWLGQLAASLWFDRKHGPVALAFAAGYDEPAVVLAAIDNLRTALTALRDEVERVAAGPLPTADDVLGILAEDVP